MLPPMVEYYHSLCPWSRTWGIFIGIRHRQFLFACLHICVYVHNHSNVVRSKHATMKTVAIISQKGGAGKTTVAFPLAVAAEQHGVRTAVFDLDPQASAPSWADRRKTPIPAVVAAQPPRLV